MINGLISRIQHNPGGRDKFIQEHKDFIRQTANEICKRSLHWENDEELSIALLAFDEAINDFNPTKGSFLGFARLLIRRRLIDYFRREKRHTYIPVDGSYEDVALKPEINRAWHEFHHTAKRIELAEEIQLLREKLAEYDIDFEALTRKSPTHQQTRENLLDAVRIIIVAGQGKQILATKSLPLRQLVSLTGRSRKVFKTWRKYIMALVIIASTPELEHIRHFIGIDGE